jgi:hypothetical protein
MEKSRRYTLRLDCITSAASAASSTLTHATSVTCGWERWARRCVRAGAGEWAGAPGGGRGPVRARSGVAAPWSWVGARRNLPRSAPSREGHAPG